MSELPIICTLSPHELRQRREALLPGLLQRAELHEILNTGIRVRFGASSEVLADIAKMIDAER